MRKAHNKAEFSPVQVWEPFTDATTGINPSFNPNIADFLANFLTFASQARKL